MRKSVFISTLTIIFSTLFTLYSPLITTANDVSVTNVRVVGDNPATLYTAKVYFDISWSNSWRNLMNYDAVWVFVKYLKADGVTWGHALMKTSGTNPVNTSTGVGSTAITMVVPEDKTGAFLQRSGTGSGSTSMTSVVLVWDWSSAGLSQFNTSRVDVFAVEMVYVPQGFFYLGSGSGAGATSEFYNYSGTGPYQVTSESAINVGTVGGYLYYPSSANGGDRSGPIPAAFPKGYNAFYIMKYEMSQGQYRDFLNNLSSLQQTTRVATTAANYYAMSGTNSVLYRQVIRVPASVSGTTPITFGCDLNGNGTFNESNDGEWISCNYLSYPDVAAYAAWSGLRPLTELEYEKACRGTEYPRPNEYAWGTTDITQVTSISSTGTNSEVGGNTGAGLCVYGSHVSVQCSIRSGFAATSTTTRLQAGASCWGVMELSGNNWERTVNVGDATGRSFTGAHGTGVLSGSGNAAISSWPGYSVGTAEVTLAGGSGFRGASWTSGSGNCFVSDRANASYIDSTRYNNSGGRLVRIAPTY